MFVVTNRIPVNAAYEVSFEGRFAERAGSLEQQPGFVDFKLLRPISKIRNPQTDEIETLQEQGFYLVQTVWQSEQDFWNWTQSDAFRQAHADKPPVEMFAGQSQMEMHEIIISDGQFKYRKADDAEASFDDGE